jgi:hypothetical protein
MPRKEKKKKLTAAEVSAKREADFLEHCVKIGVNPDTSSSGESMTESEDQEKDELDRQSDDEDDLDKLEKEVAIPETDIHVDHKSTAEVEDRDIEGKSGSITGIKTNLQPRAISMPITSILMTDNSHRSPVHHVVQSSSQARLDSLTAEIPIPSDQQLHKSPSRLNLKSGGSPAKSPIPKVGSQTGKRIQVQQPPYATPSKNLKEKPTLWTTPPPNLRPVSEDNRHMSSPIISTPKLLTPTADQEAVTDEGGVSNVRKELSFADELVSTRYFKDKKTFSSLRL